MLAIFKNEAELEAFLRSQIAAALGNTVLDTVRKTEQKHIESDVYGVYEPRVYQNLDNGQGRRGYDGGLIADENIVGEVNKATLELTVTNVTPPNPYAKDAALVTINKDLPELIEYGNLYMGNVYDFMSDGAYMDARPFTQNTINELEETREHEISMAKALRKSGIYVRQK